MPDESPRTRTRCFVNAKRTELILRCAGVEDWVVPLLDDAGKPRITGDRIGDLVIEACALLLLRGKTIEEIVSGAALPDRWLPTPKIVQPRVRPLTRVKQAIAHVKAAEMTRESSTERGAVSVNPPRRRPATVRQGKRHAGPGESPGAIISRQRRPRKSATR
jgi:hypothetical protein